MSTLPSGSHGESRSVKGIDRTNDGASRPLVEKTGLSVEMKTYGKWSLSGTDGDGQGSQGTRGELPLASPEQDSRAMKN